MKRALGAAFFVTVALTAPAAASSHRAASTVHSSIVLLGGTIRITAIADSAVQAGQALDVKFRVRNLSSQPQKLDLGFQSFGLVVHAPDGTRYDTRVVYGSSPPFIPATTLQPGQTVTKSWPYLRDRWSGPLQVTPGWDRYSLRTLQIGVTTPAGAVPTKQAAVSEIVAATGHLLDHCRPQSPGVAVSGRIDAPQKSAPPLAASCAITVRHESGFLTGQVLVKSPAGLQGVALRHPYELFTGPKSGQNAEAIAWLFVVTSKGATSVDSTSDEATKAGTKGKPMTPQWQWTTSGPQGLSGSFSCGGTGGGGGGYVGPLVAFVSACPS